MSPILDLQKRLHEDGRIRIGHQVESSNGKKRPAKLEQLRFTSSSERAIRSIAQRYGGDAHVWDGAPVGRQFEVFTEAVEIPVVVPPERMSFSQFYETWTAGGCKRRCDGEWDTISDGPCVCDPENRECKPHSRLSVMLGDYPGTGLWRIDTSSWYATNELAGAFELAQLLVQSTGRSVLAARLRLEQRQVKRPDPKEAAKVVTRNFPVVVLDFDADLASIALGRGSQAAIAAPLSAPPLPEGSSDFHGGADETSGSAGLTPIPKDDAPTPTVAEQMAAVEAPADKKPRKNSPPAIPATGRAPRPAAQAEADDGVPTLPRPEVTDEDRDAAIERAKERTTKAQAAAKKAPDKKAAAAKKAAPRTDDVNEPNADAAQRSTHLPNGELRITQPMVTSIQIEFKKMDPNGTREARLRYARKVVQDESIESTWDMSVAQGQLLLSNLKIVNGEEPPDRTDEDTP